MTGAQLRPSLDILWPMVQLNFEQQARDPGHNTMVIRLNNYSKLDCIWQVIPSNADTSIMLFSY